MWQVDVFSSTITLCWPSTTALHVHGVRCTYARTPLRTPTTLWSKSSFSNTCSTFS